MSGNGFTPTERKIIAMLADGLPHSKEELHGCLVDDLGAATNVRVHIRNLRIKLRPKGEEIVCEYRYRKYRYRHILLLPNSMATKSQSKQVT